MGGVGNSCLYMCIHRCTQVLDIHGSFLSQYNQWICFALERRAQNVPHPGLVTITQSEIFECLSPSGKTFILIICSTFCKCSEMTGRFGPVCLSLNFRSIASKLFGLSVGKQFATLSRTPAFVFLEHFLRFSSWLVNS